MRLIKWTISMYLFSCIFKTGWKAWSLLIKSWINMRFPPVKAQPAAWAQTFPTRQGWIVQVQLAEPCCQQLVWYVQSARSGLAHREWDPLNMILVPQSLKVRFKDALASFQDCGMSVLAFRTMILLPGTHIPYFHLREEHMFLSKESGSTRWNPKVGDSSELPKNTAPPHYSLGSKHIEHPRKLGQPIWTSNQTYQEHTQISEVFADIVLPTLRFHAWAAFCPSVCHPVAGHPPIPTLGGEMLLGMEHMLLLPAVQKEASGSRGGWWMAREGAGGQSRPCDHCSARRKASDAKSISIMAIQGWSKIAFLILESADRKHPPG